ncbi:hypothetical protein F441_06573 [Phytophthora nicotianae CJ01A1]|uniref:Uncharacterized protein n=2 Tax=Phytophthora nicotianae TaxID=4792 RepID=W2J9C3_PHYNI|nr:hypothetical protein L915_06437 [Phytophthora nicotianae]ETL43065.1 hypothetical protein L916_06313 [Phytophthora nicotianae]ETL96235.1 hypothetical protein L917_06182 [Phytophthora nicotianae]ETP19464.1 hypothetical protein F441_06573 [Phytophthora nicotianae CJ01A1]
MRSFAGRLEGLEKSQSKFEENLDAEGNKRGGKSKSYDAPMTPTVNSSSDDNFEVIDNRRSTSGSAAFAVTATSTARRQHQSHVQARYPDVRQKNLATCPFGGKALYAGLGASFLE